MDIKTFINKMRRDFNISVVLIGVIPLLVCVYLIAGKISNVNALVGEIGFVVFCAIVVFVCGVLVGTKMFNSFTGEILEKNKLAAITEVVLGVGDQINNPLMAIRGNLEILETYAVENNLPSRQVDRIKTIKDNMERIRQITDSMSQITSAKSTTAYGKTKMTDFSDSVK